MSYANKIDEAIKIQVQVITAL